jgi:lysophospholipase L1-like esterase
MKILFQGDSITDMGRDRSDPHDLGTGYPRYAAELISKKYSDYNFEFINLGISGDRAENLLARWQQDCIDIQPDIVSILIGVNDTCHHAPAMDWMSHDYFENCYNNILTQVKEKTKAKIIILEQFLLSVPNNRYPLPGIDDSRVDLNPKIDITRKLARKFADAFIPLDGLFAAASVRKEPSYWAADGVHPTNAGAELIAEQYLNASMPIIENYYS